MKDIIIDGIDYGYKIDEFGNLYSPRGTILKPKRSRYVSYGLSHPRERYRGGKKTWMYIHRIVAIMFIPNPEGKEQINHKDFNRHNNHVSNLEWVTASENQLHRYKFGINKDITGDNNPNSRYKRNLKKH